MHPVWVACILYLCARTAWTADNSTEFVLLNSTEFALLNSTEFDLGNSTESKYTLPAFLQGKHESLLSCVSYALDRDEVEFLPGSLLYIPDFDLTLNKSIYIDLNDTFYICKPESNHSVTATPGENKPLGLTSYLTLIGLSVSMISLFLHLVVFALVPDLRNLPGWNLATLCASLFISYASLLLIGVESISDNKVACSAVASTTHFFLFSSFMWMSIISFDVCLSVLKAIRRCESPKKFSRRRFAAYCLIAFGTALLFTILGVVADSLDVVPGHLKPRFSVSCWFSQMIPLLVLFNVPVFFLSFLNIILFGVIAVKIHASKRRCDEDAHKPAVKSRYMMYFRLSVIMGVTWIVGIAANLANVDWLWIIFVLLNAFQGFFIFLAFTCTDKVKKHFQKSLRNIKKASTDHTTITSHS